MSEYDYTLNEVLLSVQNLNVTYGENVILRDVNFEIKNLVRPAPHTQGQVNALLAPSGMGKTQLFRCISGIQKIKEGGIFLNTSGDPTADGVPVAPGQVGVVAQNYPLFNHLTVLENVVLAARIRKPKKAEATELSINYLTRFGLEDRIKLYPHQISGGQQQRVAIICQMVSCGHMLLMDEPFSGLDPLMRDEVQALITSVAAANELNTMIITTHDIQSAIAVADTILLLGRDRDEDGNIIPGARIQKEINLIERGLTWRPNIMELPAFFELEKEIKAEFRKL